jgi:hypothetical protein
MDPATVAISDLEDDVEHDFWEKVTLLTKAFYHKSIEDVLPNGKVWRIMHASAGIDFFPPNLLRLLTAAFPDDMTEEDEDGNLPIHVAAMGNFYPSTSTEEYSGDFVANSGTAASTIAILLEVNPSSARCRNRQGKSPLQLAIESGRDWEDGIGALADAFLAAIGERDKETGLDLFLPLPQRRIARLPSFTICFEPSHFELYFLRDLILCLLWSTVYTNGTVELRDAGFSGVPFEYSKIASGITNRSVNALSNHV